jgi:DNA-binding response OmpR family regulator
MDPVSSEMARILVVGEEPRIVGIVCRALSVQGFSADGASDAALVLRPTHDRDYDLVVLDMARDRVYGITILERIMKSQPHLPVLVLSALTDVDLKVRCFELGAADYMNKPFALAELSARISARLSSPASAGEQILTHNGLKLDLRRRLVNTAEGTVRLSRRECLLLEHLVRHQGEVFSRAELLEEVWGFSFDPGTNVVNVYVSRLRAKLGSSVIETVRDVGYCVPSHNGEQPT